MVHEKILVLVCTRRTICSSRYHGRKDIESISSSINMHRVVDDNSNSYKNIIMDAMRINQGYTNQCPIIDEEPNANITEFFFFLSFERS
jgi:hypothetical protein